MRDSVMNNIFAYFKRITVVGDIALNVIVLFGLVETISSRCGKQIASGTPCATCCWMCAKIDKLFNGRWKNHCLNNRMVLPEESK